MCGFNVRIDWRIEMVLISSGHGPAGHWLFEPDVRLPPAMDQRVIGYLTPDVGLPPEVIVYLTPDVGFPPEVIGYLTPDVGFPPEVIGYLTPWCAFSSRGHWLFDPLMCVFLQPRLGFLSSRGNYFPTSLTLYMHHTCKLLYYWNSLWVLYFTDLLFCDFFFACFFLCFYP